jgi:hypothetical protein
MALQCRYEGAQPGVFGLILWTVVQHGLPHLAHYYMSKSLRSVPAPAHMAAAAPARLESLPPAEGSGGGPSKAELQQGQGPSGATLHEDGEEQAGQLDGQRQGSARVPGGRPDIAPHGHLPSAGNVARAASQVCT